MSFVLSGAQRSDLDIPVKHFGAFRLEQDFAFGRKWIRSPIGKLAVNVLPHLVAIGNQFHQVPFAARFFDLSYRIAVAGHVLPGTFSDPVDPYRLSGRTGDTLSIDPGNRGAIGHPEISRSSFLDLKLNRARPNLVGPLDVEQNATVASLPYLLDESALAPFKFRAQIKMLERLLRNDVPHLGPGDMDYIVLHREDVIGIGVQSFRLQKRVELAKIAAFEENDGLLMRGNVDCERECGSGQEEEPGVEETGVSSRFTDWLTSYNQRLPDCQSVTRGPLGPFTGSE